MSDCCPYYPDECSMSTFDNFRGLNAVTGWVGGNNGRLVIVKHNWVILMTG